MTLLDDQLQQLLARINAYADTRPIPWRAISERLYMLSYEQFCQALELEPDYYAEEKYADVKALAKAMARVSIHTLEALTKEGTHS